MPGLFVQRQAEALASDCLTAVLYVHEDEHAVNHYEAEMSEENGVHVVRVYFHRYSGQIAMVNRTVNGCRFLKAHRMGFRMLKNFSPDILHVHVLTRLGLVAWIYGRMKGIPYVVTEHWSRYFAGNAGYSGWLRKVLTNCVARHAGYILPVSAILEKAMRAQGIPGNYRVLPNIVNTADFRIPGMGKESQGVRRRMIHVSCFDDRSKNISGFLRVVKLLSQKRADFDCLLVGEGPDHGKMKSLANELGLDGIARFSGLLESGKLAEEMSRASFLVLSSRYETFGTVIIEALACGLPVVSTRVGIAPEVVGAENGILCDSDNPAALENALSVMLDMCGGYNKESVRRSIPAGFLPENVTARLIEIYHSVIQNSR
jgi:glycosyltransferase involved in cell wall biosynthesis